MFFVAPRSSSHDTLHFASLLRIRTHLGPSIRLRYPHALVPLYAILHNPIALIKSGPSAIEPKKLMKPKNIGSSGETLGPTTGLRDRR